MLNTPGISLTETLLQPSSAAAPTALPIFVGMTGSGPQREAVLIESFSHFESVFGEPPKHHGLKLHACVNHYFDNGGGPCLIFSLSDSSQPTDLELISSYYRDPDIATRVLAYEEVTLVCFPDAVAASFDAEDLYQIWAAPLYWASALSKAANRNILLLIDAPRSLEDANIFRDRLNSEESFNGYASVYWPHLITDTAAEHAIDTIIPPCGAVAAAIYKTDATRGIWKAPANIRLSHVVSPEVIVRGKDPLFSTEGSSINLIRALPGYGTRIWGCRTLATAFPGKYIHTRRLMSYIETNLSEIARFAVFESNDEITWLKLKGLSRAWLRRLWLRGALAGNTEDEAFRITLGLGESMAKDDIIDGRMIARIGVALLHPAEFIEIKLTFNLSGSAFPGAGTVLAESVGL